jgi:hypothetical protein
LFAAWQDDTSGFSEIYAARFDGIAGTRQVISVSGGGVSNSIGEASRPVLASGGSKLHLVWADDTLQSRVGEKIAVYAMTWNGSAFVEDLAGDADFHGVSFTGGVLRSLDLAVDGGGHPIVVWNDQASGSPQVQLRANYFDIAGTVFTAGAGTSVQTILDANDLNPGQVILVTGSTGGFNVVATDAVAFLSGGQSDVEATARLDAMNKIGGVPWRLSFSYGRALQAAPQKAWSGKAENKAAAQAAFAHRAEMNGLATLGKWARDFEQQAA